MNFSRRFARSDDHRLKLNGSAVTAPFGPAPCHRHGWLAELASESMFTDGRVEEYEDPMTFDLLGWTLKVFKRQGTRTGPGTICTPHLPGIRWNSSGDRRRPAGA